MGTLKSSECLKALRPLVAFVSRSIIVEWGYIVESGPGTPAQQLSKLCANWQTVTCCTFVGEHVSVTFSLPSHIGHHIECLLVVRSSSSRFIVFTYYLPLVIWKFVHSTHSGCHSMCALLIFWMAYRKSVWLCTVECSKKRERERETERVCRDALTLCDSLF